MNKEDFNQIVTVRDLEAFRKQIINDLKGMLFGKVREQKEFYTPKEFSYLTGIKYSTVVYHCTTGKLKARQDNPKSSWSIYASELERFKTEADENVG